MKLAKGMTLVFKDRRETIEKASNNRMVGEVRTNTQTYSTDFIMRWVEMGFVEVRDKHNKTIQL